MNNFYLSKKGFLGSHRIKSDSFTLWILHAKYFEKKKESKLKILTMKEPKILLVFMVQNKLPVVLGGEQMIL